MGVHLRSVHVINVYLTRCASHKRASLKECIRGVHIIGVHLVGVHLIGVNLISVHLTGVYLTDMHLTGVYLTDMHLIGVHLMGVHLMGVSLFAGMYLTGLHLSYEPYELLQLLTTKDHVALVVVHLSRKTELTCDCKLPAEVICPEASRYSPVQPNSHEVSCNFSNNQPSISSISFSKFLRSSKYRDSNFCDALRERR
jgi:uncharacterized protein YjbI with pentapeptide repeats